MPWPREWCLRIAELVSRGKEQLVLIVGIAKAWCFTRCITLIMCETEAGSQGRKGELSKQEPELGVALIDQLAAEEFNPENYKDEYRIQVWQCWIKEVGQEITMAAPAPKRGRSRQYPAGDRDYSPLIVITTARAVENL